MTKLNIVYEIGPSRVPKFSDLNAGDYFLFNQNLYVKIQGAEPVCNAINIKTASTAVFNKNDSIIPIESVQIRVQ